MYGFSVWSLLLILAIVVLLFGTGKLRNIGSDLGGAIRGFNKAMKDGEKDTAGSQRDEGETQLKGEGHGADSGDSRRSGDNDRGD